MNVSLAAPRLDEETLDEVDNVLREEFFVGGETVSAFESDLESEFDVEHAVALDSGTRALSLALEAAGIGAGDTVVTTPATFVASANAAVHAGATPRFVDVDLDTLTIDVEALERFTADHDVDAVIPVHLYGYPVDVDAVREAVGDVPIVADACQAHGARRNRKSVGSMADAAALSFYPSKNMTVAGDGGALLTDDADLARAARSLRDVGRSESGYHHERIGYTARLNTVNAAVGRMQLERLEEWNTRRRETAATYHEAFAGLDLVRPPVGSGDVEPAWYFYAVRVDDPDAFRAHLDDRGIETGRQYQTPVHLQPPYRERGFEPGDFPRSETWSETVVTLPCHQYMTSEQVDHVVESVRGFYE